MTESPRLELILLCCFFINSFWNHRSSRSMGERTWTEIGFWGTYTLRRARSTDTHPTCSPALIRKSGRGGCSTDSCTSRGETFHIHALFSFHFYCGGCVWECGGHSSILSLCVRLEEAWIICMVCYKLSRAAIACQNSSTCVCVSDRSSMGTSPGLHHPLTHSQQQF